MGLLGYLVGCNVSSARLFGQKDRLSLLEMLKLKERGGNTMKMESKEEKINQCHFIIQQKYPNFTFPYIVR